MKLLSTLHPTQNQLMVLAKIIANKEHPTQAAEEISTNENLISARNMLMKLNVITYSDTTAELTDKGMQIAQDHGIADEAGELTDKGRQLTGETEPSNGTEPPMDQMGGMGMPQSPGTEMGLPPSAPGPSLGMEGFSRLFKNIICG